MPAARKTTPRSAAARRGANAASLPASYEPQLATLVKAAPEGDAWMHEMKFDGYRIGCRVDDGDVTLLSRRGKDWTESFPELTAAAKTLRGRRVLLDGEVAVLLSDGRTSFQALQNWFGGGPRKGLVYFAFDLLHLDGEEIARLPLDERKARLHALLGRGDGVIRYSDHVIGGGAAFFGQACRMGLEGIVSKQRALPYQAGRNAGWVKTKCVKRQEFVIVGFTDPEGSRVGLGALLIGVHDGDGKLVFAGKVGTGFTQKSAREIRNKLEAIEQKTTPLAVRPAGWLGANAHWVRPMLVAEVEFTEWTEDGKIRHPSFQGLRADKSPKEIVMEKAVPAPAAETPKRAKGSRRPAAVKATAKPTRATSKPGAGEKPVIAGVAISNPQRLLWPDAKVSKLELARYYEAIAEWAVPHVAGRPLTLVRCPKGLTPGKPLRNSFEPRDGVCFYMKHSSVWAPPALRRVPIQEKTKIGEYLVADDLAGLISLVQMDVMEVHTWNSTEDDVERPDRVVFDLDPGPEVKWRAVVDAARLVHEALDALGLQSFLKTTGGKGLHIVVPLAPDRPWEDCFAFTRAFSETIEAQRPREYTTAMPKAGREKKILLDYFRNNRTNTSVTAYSPRARPAAAVSVPIAWDELSPKLDPQTLTVKTVPQRLKSIKRDPWEKYWQCKQRLSQKVLRALGAMKI